MGLKTRSIKSRSSRRSQFAPIAVHFIVFSFASRDVQRRLPVQRRVCGGAERRPLLLWSHRVWWHLQASVQRGRAHLPQQLLAPQGWVPQQEPDQDQAAGALRWVEPTEGEHHFLCFCNLFSRLNLPGGLRVRLNLPELLSLTISREWRVLYYKLEYMHSLESIRVPSPLIHLPIPPRFIRSNIPKCHLHVSFILFLALVSSSLSLCLV